MKREQYTSKSKALGQDLSMIVYGEKGYPVVAFQTQNAKCGEFEEKGMVETLAPFIDAGQIQLFSVDNIDEQSWSLYDGDKNARAERQEEYFRFVTDELVPRVHEFNGTSRRPLAVGCSMGAVHAALAAMRRPDLFQGCISLSGVYRSNHFYGDWMSSTLYNNDITAFLPNMAKDHPYVDIYNKRQIVFCVGQGEDDGIGDVRFINDQLNRLGVDHWCDFWGRDVSHDWFWWTKQMSYFLPFVLEDIEKTTAGEKFETVKKPAAKKAEGRREEAGRQEGRCQEAGGEEGCGEACCQEGRHEDCREACRQEGRSQAGCQGCRSQGCCQAGCQGCRSQGCCQAGCEARGEGRSQAGRQGRRSQGRCQAGRQGRRSQGCREAGREACGQAGRQGRRPQGCRQAGCQARGEGRCPQGCRKARGEARRQGRCSQGCRQAGREARG